MSAQDKPIESVTRIKSLKDSDLIKVYSDGKQFSISIKDFKEYISGIKDAESKEGGQPAAAAPIT